MIKKLFLSITDDKIKQHNSGANGKHVYYDDTLRHLFPDYWNQQGTCHSIIIGGDGNSSCPVLRPGVLPTDDVRITMAVCDQKCLVPSKHCLLVAHTVAIKCVARSAADDRARCQTKSRSFEVEHIYSDWRRPSPSYIIDGCCTGIWRIAGARSLKC
jgi:hypothetical protein